MKISDSERNISPERIGRGKGFIVFDLDGVVVRYPGYHTINPVDYGVMGTELSNFQKEGGRVGILTNRPPGEMQPVAYFLGQRNGVWVTESGGSAYRVADNKISVPESWKSYAEEKVPALRTALRVELGIGIPPRSFDSAQLIPGIGPVKTVIIPPRGISTHDYSTTALIPLLESTGLAKDFVVKPGKAIDIDPVGLSKRYGMALLLELNGVDPTKDPTLFIADHARDVPAAEELMQRGGMVAAVGNADSDYIDYVEKSGGIVAPKDTEYHRSVAKILDAWRNRNE